MERTLLNYEDRRSAPRTATTLRGKMFLPAPVDCVIADFSKHGARLRFDEPLPISDELIVVIWSSGVAYEAVTRWRTEMEAGVEFLGNRDLRRPAPPHLAAAQDLWRHRRPRMSRRQVLKQAAILQAPAGARRGLDQAF